MNKSLLLLFILFLYPVIFSVEYDDILKMEAKGDYTEAINLYKIYFEENLNDVNQDSIIEKLLHCSTLYDNLKDTLQHLIHYVKYMKNPHSRFIIYKRIGEIYEISGNIYMAGVYYEKAAYINDEYMDYDLFFDSIEVLIELGYLNLSLKKIDSLDETDSYNINRYNIIKARLYKLLGDRENALKHFYNIDKFYYKWDFYALDLDTGTKTEKESLDSLIFTYPYLRARTPTDYFNRESVVGKYTKLPPYPNKEVELFIGKYSRETDYAGIINFLEQLNVPWYLDKRDIYWYLYAFTLNLQETKSQLKKAGIDIGD